MIRSPAFRPPRRTAARPRDSGGGGGGRVQAAPATPAGRVMAAHAQAMKAAVDATLHSARARGAQPTTETWGPEYWHYIHSAPFVLVVWRRGRAGRRRYRRRGTAPAAWPSHYTLEEKEAVLWFFVHAIPAILPCDVCRIHWRDVPAPSMGVDLAGPVAAFRYTWRSHNLVTVRVRAEWDEDELDPSVHGSPLHEAAILSGPAGAPDYATALTWYRDTVVGAGRVGDGRVVLVHGRRRRGAVMAGSSAAVSARRPDPGALADPYALPRASPTTGRIQYNDTPFAEAVVTGEGGSVGLQRGGATPTVLASWSVDRA